MRNKRIKTEKQNQFLMLFIFCLLVMFSSTSLHSKERKFSSRISAAQNKLKTTATPVVTASPAVINALPDSNELDNLKESLYSCPMHADETSHKPGSCPVCGMFLVAQDIEETEHTVSHVHYDNKTEGDKDQGDVSSFAKQDRYWESDRTPITTHKSSTVTYPETHRLQPESADALPAKIIPLLHETEKSAGSILATYQCPMHPHIMQHESGSCPICGMDLVSKEKSSTSNSEHPQVFLEAAVIQNMGVRTAHVQRKILQKKIHTQGLVTPDDDRIISIHPRTAGWVEVLHLITEGDRVERKEELVDFYSPWLNQVQLNYIQALEEYDQTSFEPSRKTEIGAKVDSLQNSLRLLNVMDMDIMRIKNSRKVQNTIQIKAPQGGIITSLNVNEGSYVVPYQSMFTIVDLSSVWIMVDIYEHQAPWVRKGHKVVISAPAIPARTWNGTVDYIYPEVDSKTRTLRARIAIPNPDEALLLNMFVKVDISANATKNAVLSVPREAIIITGERETVIKALGKGHFQPVEVKTGMRGEGSVEILSGLQKTDEVVVSGQFLIDSESSLQASFLRMSE